MANQFFDPGEQRSAKVQDLFGRIARRYDLINDLQSFGLHRRWKRRLVELAACKTGSRLLDVCCGTADISIDFASAGFQVVGLDFSSPMLERARAKAEDVIQFIHGDAQALPFADNSFEIVVVGYGLRNLADWKSGLLEMWRVAKPGGRLLVLDFGKPESRLWRAAYFGYLRLGVPLLGKIFCGDSQAYAYILESLQHFPAQHGIAEQMRILGFSDVRTTNLLGGAMAINCGVKR